MDELIENGFLALLEVRKPMQAPSLFSVMELDGWATYPVEVPVPVKPLSQRSEAKCSEAGDVRGLFHKPEDTKCLFGVNDYLGSACC